MGKAVAFTFCQRLIHTSSWRIAERNHFWPLARLNFDWFTFICFHSIQCIAISEQSFNCRFSSSVSCCNITHDDVIKWKHFPRYWTFERGIHLPPVHSPHKGQWRGALMFSLISALNKRLSKQSWGWWFETPSRSIWRQCNAWWHDDARLSGGRVLTYFEIFQLRHQKVKQYRYMDRAYDLVRLLFLWPLANSWT